MAKKLDFIKKFIKTGISVIPLHHRSKIPDTSLTGGTWEQFQTQLPTKCEVNSWFPTDWNNYAVVAGWRGLAFLDFDDMQAFSLWFDYFCLLNKHFEIYPIPFIVSTSRGAHVYLSMPEGGINHRRRGCDVKFHGYVVGPGCIHPNGTQYVALTDFQLTEVYSLATILPEELFPVVSGETYSNCLELDFNRATTECNYDPFDTASNGNNMDLITRIKHSLRIETLFSNMQRTSIDGRWYVALCPFHDDHHPSLWIDTRRQLCGCNVCNMRSMDVINLFARMHNVSESIAVRELARELGV